MLRLDLDEAADGAIHLLAPELDGAGEHLQRLRDLRECVGSG